MSRSPSRSWSSIALVALAWALGGAALRALLPMLVFAVRDRFRWSALGAVATIEAVGESESSENLEIIDLGPSL